jgi:hypothetical protein
VPQFSETGKVGQGNRTSRVKHPRRCLPAPAGTKEEDGVVAGLGYGAGDKVLDLAGEGQPRWISEAFSTRQMCGGWVDQFDSHVVGV